MLVTLSKSDLQRLSQIIREETGNQIQEKNHSMIESRIRSHILKLGLESVKEYWEHFQANERAEREVIQSLMTTHYTFFFREFAHFELLEKWVKDEFSRLKERFEKSRQPVRIWSAACSRGHEVYSLAMFLEENLAKKFGIPFEIIGTDIDLESIAYAQNGVYSIREVNTLPHMYLNGYWKRGTGAIKEFAAIHPNIKQRTKFESLNLLEVPKWANNNVFDVIFCRNVFIYFSEENVKKIAMDLSKKVDARGLLISGMSEPLRFPELPLISVGPSTYQNLGKNAEVQPAKTAGGLPQRLEPKLPPQETKVETRYRVLCVDDSSTIQLLIKKIFANDPNCQGVDTAENGRDARQKLDAKKYDIVTLDIHMPEVNGIEFLEKLYNRKDDPPVLMISSVNRTDIELATKAMSLGAFDYVEKPAMNNLQKSTDEILTKTKMALRAKNEVRPAIVPGESFDASIGQKIVVPDASLCLRIVVASSSSLKKLEQVVRGQKNEYRSPPLLVLWSEDQEDVTSLESQLLDWTEQQILNLRENKQSLRPNQIYIVQNQGVQDVITSLRMKSVSLQFLSPSKSDFTALMKLPSVQILLDESMSDQATKFEKQLGRKLSDVTPATSFPSLSVEFFAHLRKAAA